jgi:class 3 adenylate cyclase
VTGLYFARFAGAGLARQAVLTAERIRREDAAGLPIRIAAHTGTAYAGVAGSRDTFVDYTVRGDAVNIAAAGVVRLTRRNPHQ